MKFTDTGSVDLTVDALECFEEKYKLSFKIEDTGIGLQTDEIDKLFEKFTQADITTTRRFGGSGLGLSLSREIVHLMGGEIGAFSNPQGGASFWFHVILKPGISSAMNLEGPVEELEKISTDFRVLIAEDNDINQEVFKSMKLVVVLKFQCMKRKRPRKLPRKRPRKLSN